MDSLVTITQSKWLATLSYSRIVSTFVSMFLHWKFYTDEEMSPPQRGFSLPNGSFYISVFYGKEVSIAATLERVTAASKTGLSA